MKEKSTNWEKFDSLMYMLAQVGCVWFLGYFFFLCTEYEVLWLFLLLGLIPAIIAVTKERSFVIWWAYGTSLPVIALMHIVLIKRANSKKCNACAEFIKSEAKICKHCNTVCS